MAALRTLGSADSSIITHPEVVDTVFTCLRWAVSNHDLAETVPSAAIASPSSSSDKKSKPVKAPNRKQTGPHPKLSVDESSPGVHRKISVLEPFPTPPTPSPPPMVKDVVNYRQSHYRMQREAVGVLTCLAPSEGGRALMALDSDNVGT